jgi:hypothetical protein
MYNYTYSYYYEDDYLYNLNSVTENDLMWQKYCDIKIEIPEIKKAVFQVSIDKFNNKNKNPFIQYLFTNEKKEAIDYLIFAKSLEKLSKGDDLWENNQDVFSKIRKTKIDEAFKRIEGCKEKIIQKRYLYQIFRLLQYNGDSKEITSLYSKYFDKNVSDDFIDDWALYYRMNAEKDDIKMNLLAAQVFARGTDNKFEIRWNFNKDIPIDRVLELAETDEERANVYILYSFKKTDRNLNYIKKIYSLDKSNKGLNFLLLREINKLEDWILTPSYTMYLPVLREDYWENNTTSRILNRVEEDRSYAKEVLDFVEIIDEKAVVDSDFWNISKAYLFFLNKEYKKGLEVISSCENNLVLEKSKQQVNIIKALCLTANQELGNVIVLDEVKPILLKASKNNDYRFLFAIAKELEFLGNNIDAGFIISHLNNDKYGENSTFWKSRNNRVTLSDDYFYDWYGYIDSEFSLEEMKGLVSELELNTNNSDFDLWKLYFLRKEKSKIYDLLGIKYIRENQLENAYIAFSRMPKDHYTNHLFNENPFYKIKGYMNFDNKKSAISLSKASVVKELLYHINRGNAVDEKEREKHYFLAANCYYNMSYHGNSWMLRRIYWSTNEVNSNLIDEDEYKECNLAKVYYLKAYKSAKTEEFKALCIYMKNKCDARKNSHNYFKLLSENRYSIYNNKEYDSVIDHSFQELKSKYPNEYSDLVSNCEIYSEYYNLR